MDVNQLLGRRVKRTEKNWDSVRKSWRKERT